LREVDRLVGLFSWRCCVPGSANQVRSPRAAVRGDLLRLRAVRRRPRAGEGQLFPVEAGPSPARGLTDARRPRHSSVDVRRGCVCWVLWGCAGVGFSGSQAQLWVEGS
jgi:hypothetical protein